MRRALVVLLLAGVGLVLAVPNAGAHALLSSSEPAEGAQLDRPPGMVTLTFTEEPELALSTVRVLDAAGSSWEEGRPTRPVESPRSLGVRVRPLCQDVYTVTWRVVSRADGHATAGAFTFGVGVSPLGAPAPPQVGVATTPSPSLLEMAGRWGLLVGLIVLLGGAWVAAAIFGGSPAAVYRLTAAGWGASLVGLALFAEAQRRDAAVGFDILATTSVGKALLARGAAIVLAGGALVAARSMKKRGRLAALWVGALAASAAILAHAVAGHAGAAQSLRWGKIAAQWVHISAVAIWIGGLAALLLGTRGRPSSEKAVAVRRFSTVAGLALAAVWVTGIWRAFNEVQSWGALVSTGYGRVVLIKIGLLLVLSALGALNRYRNVPAAARSLAGLRRVSRAELALGGVTLAAAAVLASLVPRASPPAAAQEGALAVSGSDFATSVRIRLQAAPGFAGPNRFTVRLSDYDTGEPAAASRVALRFSFLDAADVGESVLELRSIGDGRYVGSGSNLSLDGRWRATVVIEQGANSLEAPLALATRCRTTALRAPGQPTLYTVELPGRGSVQFYTDPARPGRNEVHVTFFDAEGDELPVAGEVSMRASRSAEESVTLEVRRFGPGHFVANTVLERGKWRFDARADGDGGEPLRACFEERIGG
ncbi:MAG: copper resistance protein CopC [Actinomycetota bacterium]